MITEPLVCNLRFLVCSFSRFKTSFSLYSLIPLAVNADDSVNDVLFFSVEGLSLGHMIVQENRIDED